eukprot:5949175-Amphidinium_carterae.1
MAKRNLVLYSPMQLAMKVFGWNCSIISGKETQLPRPSYNVLSCACLFSSMIQREIVQSVFIGFGLVLCAEPQVHVHVALHCMLQICDNISENFPTVLIEVLGVLLSHCTLVHATRFQLWPCRQGSSGEVQSGAGCCHDDIVSVPMV